MFKKVRKKILCLILILFTFVSMIFSSSAVFAAENEAVFYPFRSDFVNYITKCASNSSVITQQVWMQLMKEETNWNSSASYYTAGYSSWSNKYYSDYVAADGSIKSSKNTQVTYNKDFDGFLYQTFMANTDFVINFLSENPAVFREYAKTAKSHPYVTDAIIDLTADGKFLGGGKDSATNVFLRGSSSSGNKYGATNITWSASATSRDTYDIDILRFFGSKYESLNATQKAWVKTYMSWMVNDYASNGANGVAAKNNSESLYNLIALSYEGSQSAKAQEFFNYDNDTLAKVGDLIVNMAASYGNTSELRTGADDISKCVSNMGAIFGADADCDYNSSWPGGSGSNFGDNDYDWLAYRIAFATESEPFYKKLNTLVSGNTTTAAQMQEWILRYYQAHASSGSDISNAVAKAGTTETVKLGNGVVKGCGNHNNKHSGGGNCSDNKHYGSYSTTIMKPIGAQKVKFTADYYIESCAITVTDTSSGTKIYDNLTVASTGDKSKETVEVIIPTKYVWSNTVQISVTYTLYKYGINATSAAINGGDAYCGDSQATCSVDWTYAQLSDCEKNGHEFTYSYKYYDAAGNEISATSNAIPVKCVANGYCAHCSATDLNQVDNAPVITDNGTTISYTFTYKGRKPSPKTIIIRKGSTGGASSTFSASSHANYLNSTLGNGVFEKTDTHVEYIDYVSNKHASASVNGTVSLKSGAIQIGAKQVTVSASGEYVTFRLMNAKKELDSMSLYSSTQGENSWTFNCSEYSDEDLQGAYVVVDMNSHDESDGRGMSLHSEVRATAKIKFNYIRVTY